MKLGTFELGCVHHGDCRDLLRQLPTESVGAIITDPPYSSGGQFRGDRTASTRSKYVQSGQQVVSADFDGDTRDQRAYTRWSEYWLRAAYHKTVSGGLLAVFADWRQLPTVTDAVQMAGWVWRGVAVWDKTEGTRPMLGRFRAQAEFVVWGTRGPAPLVGATAPGVFRQQPRSDGSDHQTAKPVAVMEWLLSIVPPQAIVLDPFSGGGATGVACARRGQPFLGFEMNAHWCEYANRRLGVLPNEAGTPLFEATA